MILSILLPIIFRLLHFLHLIQPTRSSENLVATSLLLCETACGQWWYNSPTMFREINPISHQNTIEYIVLNIIYRFNNNCMVVTQSKVIEYFVDCSQILINIPELNKIPPSYFI